MYLYKRKNKPLIFNIFNIFNMDMVHYVVFDGTSYYITDDPAGLEIAFESPDMARCQHEADSLNDQASDEYETDLANRACEDQGW